jgi:hypothetical protein
MHGYSLGKLGKFGSLLFSINSVVKLHKLLDESIKLKLY